METRIVRLKGNRFACGLAWRPQGRQPLDRRQALAEASLHGASHCVQAACPGLQADVRVKRQAGFASLAPQTEERGLRPLACALDPARLASLASADRLASADLRASQPSSQNKQSSPHSPHRQPSPITPPRRLSLLAQLEDEEGRPFVWQLVLQDGAVLAGLGDRCFASLDEAKDALVVCGALLGEEAGELRLELAEAKKSARQLGACLAPVRPAERLAWMFAGLGELVPASRWTSQGSRLARRLLAGFVLAGLLAGTGYGAAMSLGVFDEEADRSREQALAQWRAHPERAFATPWTRLPAPLPFVREACRLAYAMPSQPGGWRHEASLCQAGSPAGSSPGSSADNSKGSQACTVLVQSRYARTPDASDDDLPPGARFDAKRAHVFTLEAATGGIPLLEEPGLWRSFAEPGALSRRIQSLGRAVGAKAKSSFKPRQRKSLAPGKVGDGARPGDEAGGGFLDCPWLAGSFELSGVPAEALPDIARELAQIPGLGITTLTLTQGSWDIAGACHAQASP